VSKNGWMEEPVFYNWFENAFVPFVIKKRKDLGTNSNTLLLYDGHCSHISMRIIGLAMKNNITLFKFPSHLTDRLQPLDKCVFGPLKSVWDKELIHFGKTMIGKGPGRLTKAMFSELLGKAWSVGMKSENIISGFRTTGVFPVDKNKFPLTEFDPNELNYYLRIEAEKQNKILHSAIEPSSSTSRNILTEPNEHIELSASNDSITQCESTSLNEIIISDNIDSSPLLPHTPLSDGNHNINNLLSDETTSSPTDIIGIFTKHLGQLKAMTSSPRESKDPTPRLKTARYGEVLTNETVLMRLKEATEKHSKKKTLGAKRGRPSLKKKLFEDEEKTNTEVLTDDETTIDQLEIIGDDFEDVNDIPTDIGINEVQYEQVIWESIKPGVYVLVDFLGGPRNKTHFKYVCVVQSVDDEDGEIVVMGLKKTDDFGTEFIVDDQDITTISADMIQAILPSLKFIMKKRKMIYKFPGFVSVNEK